MQILLDNAGFLMRGIGTTLALTVLSYLFALVLGTLLAVARVSPIPPLRWAASVYVEFFRNIPLLSLLILLAFGLPDAGVQFSFFWSGVIALTLSSAAFVCENVRSGINSVPVGHAEAARSIGFGFTGVLVHVVLPQAFRVMVQPLVNVFLGTLIGTALTAAIAVPELTYVTQQLNIKHAEAVLMFLVASVVYVIIGLTATWLGARIERAVSPTAVAQRSRGALTAEAQA